MHAASSGWHHFSSWFTAGLASLDHNCNFQASILLREIRINQREQSSRILMDPTCRSYAGRGGRSLKIVTTNFYHDHPRSRPRPSPRYHKSRNKHLPISSSSSTSSAVSSSWWSNPEMKRKRRVVKYKLYAAEGKVKSSFRNGFRWIKRKCKKIVFGIYF